MSITPQWRSALIVLALTALSRAVYALAGLEFDASTFPGYMQFVDKELLATRMLESLWFLHAHPPVLNILAGIGQKLFAGQASVFFAACLHAFGYVLAWSVFLLTARISRSQWAAYVTTAVLVFSPAFVLYENWFMYTLPSAALLAAAAAALSTYLDTRRAFWIHAFFSLLAALALTRSLFHLVWLLGIAAFVIGAARTDRPRILIASIAPIAVVVGWYAKNLFYFGMFGASSMLGLGLSNITTLTVSQQELAPLVAAGRLSEYALISRYRETGRLFESQQLEPTGIPVLDAVRKSTGELNFNHRRMIEINEIYTRDGLTVAREFPFSYVLGLAVANRLFFSPSSMNEYFSPTNRDAVAPFERIYNRLLFGARERPRFLVQPHYGFAREPSLEVNPGLAIVIGWLVILPYGYVRARAGLLGQESAERGVAIVTLFMLISIAYVYATGTMVELGENYRYKFLVEPLVFVLAAMTVCDIGRWIKGRRAARSTPAL